MNVVSNTSHDFNDLIAKLVDAGLRIDRNLLQKMLKV